MYGFHPSHHPLSLDIFFNFTIKYIIWVDTHNILSQAILILWPPVLCLNDCVIMYTDCVTSAYLINPPQALIFFMF